MGASIGKAATVGRAATRSVTFGKAISKSITSVGNTAMIGTLSYEAGKNSEPRVIEVEKYVPQVVNNQASNNDNSALLYVIIGLVVVVIIASLCRAVWKKSESKRASEQPIPLREL